jgi:hypothetical protein
MSRSLVRITELYILTQTTEAGSAPPRDVESLGEMGGMVGYAIGQDWSGQQAIFFRVLLSDDAARTKLRDVVTRVIWRTSDLPNLM